MQAGKHVLCEKPFAANAEQAQHVQQVAAKQQLVCREAFHWKEHPLVARIQSIISSGELGRLEHIDAKLHIPSFLFGDSDIRFDLGLAGICKLV